MLRPMKNTSNKHGYSDNVTGKGKTALLIGRPAAFSPTGSDFLDLVRLPDGPEPAARFVADRGVPSGHEPMPLTALQKLKLDLSEAWTDYRQNGVTRRLLDKINPPIGQLRYQLVFGGDRPKGEMVGKPSNILWHQLAHAVINQVQFNGCLECGLAFTPTRGGKGESQPYCSTKCRSKAGQRRAFLATDPAAEDLTFQTTLDERFDRGGFPLAYSGVGPGVPIKDWAGAVWDMAGRRIDIHRINQHLQLGRLRGELLVPAAANLRGLEFVCEQLPI